MGAVRTAIRMVGMAAILGIVFMILVGESRPLEPGASAPPTRLRMLDGNIVNVPFENPEPMFVNIWASWCPPCLQEIPALQAASERYRGQVRFVGFAFQSKVEDVKTVLDRFGVTYPVGMLLSDGLDWHAETLPSSYLVGKDGKIVWSVRGALDEKSIDAAIERVLPRSDAEPR